MTIAVAYEGSLAVTGVEVSLITGTSVLQTNTVAGIYTLMLNLTNMAAGDTLEVRQYEKIYTAGSKAICNLWTFSNAASTDNAGWMTVPAALMNGWDFTVKFTAGPGRTVEYSIRRVA